MAKQAKKRKTQAKETKETIVDKNELVETMLGPGKGSRNVWNKIPDLQQTAAEVDDILCLPKALCSLINDDQLKCIAFNDMVMMTPTDGDMQVMHANKALSTHGLVLQRRNSNFLSKKGGPVYNLLQERCCKYVVCLKLQTSRGIACHSVGWDGTTIWDRPHKVLVNRTSDRSSIIGARNVFHKLYPKKYFQEWRVFQGLGWWNLPPPRPRPGQLLPCRPALRRVLTLAEYSSTFPPTICVMLCVGILWRALALAEYHNALPLTIYVVSM